MAVTLFSCGGGGGGGGGIAKADHNQLHNDSGNSGWGKGIETTTTSPAALGMLPQQEYDEELLFSTFPPFFSPIDHIDMTMYINDTLVEGLTGLNATTKKDVIPEVQISDKVTGTAQVTLQDGTVRNARIGTTAIDIGTTKIALYTEYKYKIMTSSTTVGGEGTFYTTDPVDVSAFVPGSVYGYSPDLNVSYFSDGTDTFAVSGGKVSLTKGDKILTPQFYSELSVVCDGTGVTPYNGADSYVYDYAQNTDGVTLTIPVPALPGVTITGTVDGNAVTLNGGSTNYTTTLLPGQHTVSLSMNGGSNFSGSGQTLSKTISVYVKPDFKVLETTGVDFDASTNICKYSYITHGDDMPVDIICDAAADSALSSVVTMNATLDGSPITATTTTTIGTHTLHTDFNGSSPYCITPASIDKTITVKIKPVKATLSYISGWYKNDEGVLPWVSQSLYIEALNSDNEYFGTAKKTIATLSSQGTTDANTIDISTNASSNFIWLTAPSSTFYYYEDTAWCSRKNKDMGTISKGDGNTTRSLQALRTNQSFNSGDHYGSGDARHIVSFTVSLDDSVDP